MHLLPVNNNNFSPRLIMTERRLAEDKNYIHRCETKHLVRDICSIICLQPYFGSQHAAIMDPFSRPCDCGHHSLPWYRENPRLMLQDHPPQQVIFTKTQAHSHGARFMYPENPSCSYPMVSQVAPNAFPSMHPDSQVGSTQIVSLYPSAMNGCPLNFPVYQTASQIPGRCWGSITSDPSHPRTYPPPFRPTGSSHGHQTARPVCHFAQSERAARTDQGKLSPGEYVDLGNSRAEDLCAVGNLEQLKEKIRPYVERELQLATHLGTSTETLDSLKVLRKVEDKALRRKDNSRWLTELKDLVILHHLRLQYSRALNSFEVKMEARRPPSDVPHAVDGSRFWAILIGIDDYELNSLNGCVRDAKAMGKYLLEDLHVPNRHIQLLLGPKESTSSQNAIYPSRDNIIGALFGIIANNQIVYGDNIIIYFSGHGSYYFPSEDDDKALLDSIGPGSIEAICPIDRDKRDGDNVPIPDISNRELNSIFSLIAREKGNHITAIFDCCHSGGVSRTLPETGARVARGTKIATLRGMLDAGEKRLGGHPSIVSRDWRPDMTSHVILAACQNYQYAKAKRVRGENGETLGYAGIFTDSLLRFLRSGSYTAETKYVDVVSYLHQSPHQTPVVDGNHKDARIWYQK